MDEQWQEPSVTSGIQRCKQNSSNKSEFEFELPS
jgi:hypothetical protein